MMKKYNIKKIYTKGILFFALLSLPILHNSCESTELELLTNPSRLTPDQASIDLFLNNIQLGTAVFFDGDNTDNFNGVNEFGMQVTRMIAMIGGNTYQNAYTPAGMNGIYFDSYTGTLIDIRTMVPLAQEQELYSHVAIAQVLEAYTIITLVDFFGDIPYSEALLGSENISPVLDAGSDVYAAAEALLNDAIANFNLDESIPVDDIDLFYGGDESKWIKLANTLKLKIYTQTKLVDPNAGSKINAIVSSGDYIQSADEDFQFDYSNVDVNPDSRHPLFGPNFDNGPAAYIGNDFSNRITTQVDNDGDPITDPRTRYYIYRQDLDFSAADSQTLPCTVQAKPAHYTDEDPYCTVGNGYWGRDHGDNRGIPPDNAFRALYGVYPVGGPFDANTGATVNDRNVGLRGAGSSMIMLSSYVDFMLAETALTSGVNGDPSTYLENGIRKSIAKVTAFGEQLDLDAVITADDPDTPEDETVTLRDFAPTAADIEAYVDAILEKYDNATDDDARLSIIVEQYYLALWQNGVEAYNTYRRTGKPDLQPTLLANPGQYVRTFPYPDAMVNRNSNIQSKPISTKVFWDTNPDNFVD